MKFFRQTFAKWRSQREAVAFARACHEEGRVRVAQLAAEGRADVALRENLALMGIDTASAERPRLVTVGGVRL